MKITIIGCGLIGGSMALALRRRRSDCSVACLDLPERIPAIKEAGITEQVGTLDDLASYVPESALVVLATPVQSVLDTMAQLAPFLKERTIVTDVSSTKKKIMADAPKLLPPGIHFIGGHPMAGSEHSGVEAANPLLFSERVYMLCPYASTPPDALLTLMDLAESLLAVPVTIDPEEHDRIMAMVSHLPQLISIALMHSAQVGDAEHEMLNKLAGRGFLDMTRLAGSDYGIWRGILETNRDAIKHEIDRFYESLSFLSNGLLGNEVALAWEKAGKSRRTMRPDSLTRPRKQDLRSMIDHYDKQILGFLGHRIEIARKIGKLKMHQSTPVTDPDRERRMMGQREEWGKSLGLPRDLVEELFDVIVKHSSRIQDSRFKIED